MTSLLSRAQSPNPEGRIQNITPESAGWKYVGFDVFKLKSGQSLSLETADREVCLVLVTGKADIKSRDESWDNLGERMSVFAEAPGEEWKPPFAVYVPNDDRFEVEALTGTGSMLCSGERELSGSFNFSG